MCNKISQIERRERVICNEKIWNKSVNNCNEDQMKKKYI